MQKRRYLLYGITALLLFLCISPALQEKWTKDGDIPRAFHETSGQVVVLFEQEIDEQDWNDFYRKIEDKADVLRRVEDYALIQVRREEDYSPVIRRLQEDSLVRAVQPNHPVSPMMVTKDSYTNSQWYLKNTGSYTLYTGNRNRNSMPGVDMELPDAWNYLKTTVAEPREVIVAIIDTGVDVEHPDLAERIWINPGEIPGDGIDNDNNGYVDDIYGWDFYNGDRTVGHSQYDSATWERSADLKDNDNHGTHVAGIIGAVAENDLGITGVTYNFPVKLMILKINGGPKGTGNISNAVEAVKYATKMGADICNISWGTQEYPQVLEEVMKRSDMLFVAAAGNTGENNMVKPVYPANFEIDNLISVTYINANGRLSRLSNYGESAVDIAAPGEEIYSTVVGGYETMSGSSMAAPMVSGVAALIYMTKENVYAPNVKEILLRSMKPLEELRGKVTHPGIPNAFFAAEVSELNLMTDEAPPDITLKTQMAAGEFRTEVKVQDSGGSGIRTLLWQQGEKEIRDFERGTSGSPMAETWIVEKAGTYTVYASDYAGNETVKVHKIIEDVTPPKINSSYIVADNYTSRTVTVWVRDKESGVRRVKYMKGEKKIEDFLPAKAGTEIVLGNDKGKFKVKKDGVYSVYAIDHRGNAAVSIINVRTVKATDIRISGKDVVVQPGDEYVLKTYLQPFNTTDRITFESKNKTIASVSDYGIVKAQKVGRTTIIARTSSGKAAYIKIQVRNIKK